MEDHETESLKTSSAASASGDHDHENERAVATVSEDCHEEGSEEKDLETGKIEGGGSGRGGEAVVVVDVERAGGDEGEGEGKGKGEGLGPEMGSEEKDLETGKIEGGSGGGGGDREAVAVVDVERGGGYEREGLGLEVERVCRICHLSTPDSQHGSQLIHLGCGCKDELGASHRHCAETWFKHRGNRQCEICGETAMNMGGGGEGGGREREDEEARRIIVVEWDERSQLRRLRRANPSSPLASYGYGGTEVEGCCGCRRMCNFLLACLVLGFTLPWFFRFQLF